MPQLILSQNAVLNMLELDLSNVALSKLNQSFGLVCAFPKSGQLSELAKEQGENIRQKNVRVGKRGYAYLYSHDQENDELIILAVKAYRQNIFSFLD